MAENRVTFTDDVLASHRYHKAFSAVKDSNIGRLSTIGKEIANMTTSLPPGIFLKVAESRSDVMKVLIVGPEGGPYAGGLFMWVYRNSTIKTMIVNGV
jgi:baculoviral IAP repeat-containing protein 6